MVGGWGGKNVNDRNGLRPSTGEGMGQTPGRCRLTTVATSDIVNTRFWRRSIEMGRAYSGKEVREREAIGGGK